MGFRPWQRGAGGHLPEIFLPESGKQQQQQQWQWGDLPRLTGELPPRRIVRVDVGAQRAALLHASLALRPNPAVTGIQVGAGVADRAAGRAPICLPGLPQS